VWSLESKLDRATISKLDLDLNLADVDSMDIPLFKFFYMIKFYDVGSQSMSRGA